MNTIQKIIVAIGLIIIVISIIEVPYTVQKGHFENNNNDKEYFNIENQWVEFRFILNPAISAFNYNDINSYKEITIVKKHDFIIQVSIILSVLVLTICLSLLFKSKKKESLTEIHNQG